MADTYSTGVVTAYGIAKLGGYTGTYEEFCEQQARYAENAQAVADAATATETAKNAAETAAINASGSATTASNKAEEAAQSAATSQTAASTATSKAADALSSANSAESAKASAQAAQTAAENAKDTAVESATTAVAKATEAAQSATTATDKAVEATEKAEEAKDAADEISATRDLLEDAFPIASASGEIITVTDAVNLPVEKLSVSLAPIQDLHGQENPYPAGGGKNKFDLSEVILTVNESAQSFSWDTDGLHRDIYTGTSGAGASVPTASLVKLPYLKAGTYVCSFSGSFPSSGITIRTVDDTGATTALVAVTASGTTFTLDTDTRITIRITNQSNDVKTITKFQIEEGSTATSYAPYENICPIGGVDSVKVTRTGKNLLNPAFSAFDLVGTYRAQKMPDTGFTLSIKDKGNGADISGVYFGITEYGINANGYVAWLIQNGTIKSTEKYTPTYRYVTIYPTGQATLEKLLARFDVQVEFNTTATDYAPYDGQSVTVQLGQTVYGGTAEIISGQGESTMAMVDLGTLNWNYDTTHNAFYAATVAYPKKYGFTNVISSAYKTRTATSGNNWNLQDKEIGGGNNSSYIYIKDTAYSTAADLKSALNGVQACYELNTPVEFTTDPASLSMLRGDNTVWSDGDSVEMEYKSANRILSEADKGDIAELVFDMIPDADTTGY